MESLIFIFFALIMTFVIGLFVKAFYNAISEKIYNDKQPVLTKDAKITAKRTQVSGGRHSAGTSYYATFEFLENKDRLELEVDPEEYGLLAEEDAGQLKFQGRRYLDFQRKI